MTKVVISEEVKRKLSCWYSPEFIDATPIYQGTLIGRIGGLFGQAAVTWNKKIHLTPNMPNGILDDSDTSILGHELYHVQQQNSFGWLPFWVEYVLYWRPWYIKNAKAHPLEEYAYYRQEAITGWLSRNNAV